VLELEREKRKKEEEKEEKRGDSSFPYLILLMSFWLRKPNPPER